jgi:hypothetical protein
VWSRNLVNEALAHWGLLRQKEKKEKENNNNKRNKTEHE